MRSARATRAASPSAPNAVRTPALIAASRSPAALDLTPRESVVDTLPAAPDDGEYVPVAGVSPDQVAGEGMPAGPEPVGAPRNHEAAQQTEPALDARMAAYLSAVSSRSVRAPRATPLGAPVPPQSPRAPAPSTAAPAGAAPRSAPTPSQGTSAEPSAAHPVSAREPAALREGSMYRFAGHRTRRPCASGERVLATGSVITAIVASAVDSEIPGTPILARISRDVYDGTLSCVILPAGSLLVGIHSDGLKHGADRLEVAWQAVRTPDGRTHPLPQLPTASRQGEAGLSGTIDRRKGQSRKAVRMVTALARAGQVPPPGKPGPAVQPVLRLASGALIAILIGEELNLDAPPPPPAPMFPVPTAGSAPSPS